MRSVSEPVDVDVDEFERLVGQALDTIPEGLLELIDNVIIVVADDPAPGDGHILGLYEGIPLTRRGHDYMGVHLLPDRISIFRNPILRMCTTREQVVREVRITVVHEVAHHFGIDDDRLHELGWG